MSPDDLVVCRRSLHRFQELGFTEYRTAFLGARELARLEARVLAGQQVMRASPSAGARRRMPGYGRWRLPPEMSTASRSAVRSEADSSGVSVSRIGVAAPISSGSSHLPPTPARPAMASEAAAKSLVANALAKATFAARAAYPMWLACTLMMAGFLNRAFLRPLQNRSAAITLGDATAAATRLPRRARACPLVR